MFLDSGLRIRVVIRISKILLRLQMLWFRFEVDNFLSWGLSLSLHIFIFIEFLSRDIMDIIPKFALPTVIRLGPSVRIVPSFGRLRTIYD